MMAALTLYTKLETLPPDLKKEASDFIDFLIQKKSKKEKGKSHKPVFGSLRGKIKLSEDFDAPLDLFNDYM
ncbi:MAG: DUF2281 domain-containing protein [Imperialibacter sp.]|uniref:type II toxin-antitoxin system VapB family antitoxin n=1 Tax=Imperialibacter sp. TaxID=2038411 RepID=UPI003A8A1802